MTSIRIFNDPDVSCHQDLGRAIEFSCFYQKCVMMRFFVWTIWVYVVVHLCENAVCSITFDKRIPGVGLLGSGPIKRIPKRTLI